LETLEDFSAVQDHVLGWIGESIGIDIITEIFGGKRIIILIGPHGSGKTTTIAKLAAIYIITNTANRQFLIRMVAIDVFGLGMDKNFEAFGRIMKSPVSYIDNHHDFNKEINLHYKKTSLFLIDTIVGSLKASERLEKMKEMLDVCDLKAENYLVIPANTKTSKINQILRQFQSFNYRSVILTKLDKAKHIGNIISVLAKAEKPVSYITDGQIIPHDITSASVVRFLSKLEGFSVVWRNK
jgi:flagellar biosynthesis protein FlhF